MKKLKSLFLLLAVLIFVNGCGKKDQTAGDDKKEKSKTEEKKDVKMDENSSFHMTYVISDEKEKNMEMELYRKGDKVKTIIDTKSKDGSVKAVAFMNKDVAYMITEIAGKKIGMKMNIKEMKDEKGMNKDIINAKEFLKDCTKSGSEDVIGYKCDIYKCKDDKTFYMYKELVPLKIITKTGTIEAKSFEADVKLSDDFFNEPKDVEYMDMNDLQKGLMNEFKKK